MAKVSITLEGGTLDEALAALKGNGPAVLVEAGTTDELIMELSNRLAAETPPRVLKIMAFAETETGKATEAVVADNKARRGRPPKTTTTTTTTTTAPIQEPKAAAAPATQPAPEDWNEGGEETGADAPYSIDDVRKALDGLRALQGMVTVRQIMSEVTGSSKLVDIPATEYGKLVARLNKEIKATAANQAQNAKGPATNLKNSKEAQELSQEAA